MDFYLLGDLQLNKVVLYAAALVVYFVPGFVIIIRKHPHGTPILLLNVFLGWTFVGWVIALIWASMPLKDET